MSTSLASAAAWRPAAFFALRTPLLPFDELREWARDVELSDLPADPRLFAEAVERTRVRLRDRLRTAISRPEIRQAVFVGSPTLEEAAGSWLRGEAKAEHSDVELPLARYYQRMAARCTPFGLFAGCSVGAVGNATTIELKATARYTCRTGLDGGYLSALCKSLAEAPALRRTLLYWPNTSLYAAGGELRYVEERTADGSRSYQLVALGLSDHLVAVLQRARSGVRWAELVQLLIRQADVDGEEADEFISELVDRQVLVSDLAPLITGGEALDDIIEIAAASPSSAPAAAVLATVRDDLAAIDAGSFGKPPELYRRAAAHLDALPAKVELARLFRADLVKPTRGTLGLRVVNALLEVVDVIRRIGQDGQDRQDRDLETFRQRFTARYQGREISLLEAVDEESGIGFGSDTAVHAVPSAREAWLLRRVFDVDGEELVLDHKDLDRISPPESADPPDAFSLVCSVLATSKEALDAGDFEIASPKLFGPSGATLVGRFCQADPVLEKYVRAHLREEEALLPDTVFAELVHLPWARLANILSRPVLRDYEIAYLGRSGCPRDHVLGVEDLVVSVVEGRIVLRSRSLGKEVCPRLTAAHNYSPLDKNLGAYRLLASLQAQGRMPGWRWRWGETLQALPVLPRVRCGRAILSPARFRLDEDEIVALRPLSPVDRVRALRAWRERRRAPRFLALQESDNELPIDFDNVLSLEAGFQVMRTKSHCILVELLHSDPRATTLATGPEGGYASELVVPFIRRAPYSPQPTSSRPRTVAAERVFLPGGSWLFAKLYAGPKMIAPLLAEVVAPLLERAMAGGGCDRWFFVRYADPDWHLRLRFHGPPIFLGGTVLPALHELCELLLRRGQIHRLALDSYDREIERYGGGVGIELAERLFHIDSEAALGMLTGGTAGESLFHLALRGVDQLFDDLSLSFDEKMALVARLSRAHGRELYPDETAWRRALGPKYRVQRGVVDALLSRQNDAGSDLADELALLERRSKRLAPIAEELRRAQERGALTAPMIELAGNFAHMHVNRMLAPEAPTREAEIYGLLERGYSSLAARRKNSSLTGIG